MFKLLWSFTKTIEQFTLKHVNLKQHFYFATGVYEEKNKETFWWEYNERINTIRFQLWDNNSSLVILHTFTKNNKFYSQLNIEFSRTLTFFTKNAYEDEKAETVTPFVLFMGYDELSFDKVFILNRFWQKSYLIFFKHFLVNQLTFLNNCFPIKKVRFFFFKPNFFYIHFNRKKIKSVKKSRKKQLYRLLKQIKINV